jgi:hypothetical protein
MSAKAALGPISDRVPDSKPFASGCKLAPMPIRRQIALAILMLVAISACTSWTPPIGRDLPRAFGPTADFDKRMQQRFPAGSDEAALVAELRQERFSIDKTRDPSGTFRHLAHYTRQDICRTSWEVLWNGEQGRIVEIKGKYSGEICL